MNISEYGNDDRQRLGTASQALAAASSRRYIDRPAERAMARFIQICASQNDLFALDEDGHIFQYNFNAQTWVRLVASRSYEGRA
jgi:hypothetical protein